MRNAVLGTRGRRSSFSYFWGKVVKKEGSTVVCGSEYLLLSLLCLLLFIC